MLYNLLLFSPEHSYDTQKKPIHQQSLFSLLLHQLLDNLPWALCVWITYSRPTEHSASIIPPTKAPPTSLNALFSQCLEFSFIIPQLFSYHYSPTPLQSYPLPSLEGNLSKRTPQPWPSSLQTLCLDFNVHQYCLGGSLRKRFERHIEFLNQEVKNRAWGPSLLQLSAGDTMLGWWHVPVIPVPGKSRQKVFYEL